MWFFDLYISHCEYEMTLIVPHLVPSVAESGTALKAHYLSRVELLNHKRNFTYIHFVEDPCQLCRISLHLSLFSAQY